MKLALLILAVATIQSFETSSYDMFHGKSDEELQ